MKTNSQLLLSAAIAGIVGTGIVAISSDSVMAAMKKDMGVKCYGINSCKGKGSCAIAGLNTCKTHNSCKGKGFAMSKNKAACVAAKGSLTAPKKKA